MKVKVYKFGGASLANLEQIKSAALFIKKERELYKEPMIIIVSAMGNTTNDLIDMAYKISSRPRKRELDMLLTAGERISMSLMSLSLNEVGVSAVSLTGSQAGIITDTAHGNARIVEVKPFRLEAHLQNDDVIVLAGFQGVSKDTKEITTLGRGGSDTTAIAMAAHFKSFLCEFKKDVGGIYSADPKVVPTAKPLKVLNHQNVYDMSFWGGKFLHYRAAELAKKLFVPLRFSHFNNNSNDETLVNDSLDEVSEPKPLAISSHSLVNEMIFNHTENIETAALEIVKKDFFAILENHHMIYPQILIEEADKSQVSLFCVGDLNEIKDELHAKITQYATVTLTCDLGPVPDSIKQRASTLLKDLPIHKTYTSHANLTYVINSSDREKVIKTLHELIPN